MMNGKFVKFGSETDQKGAEVAYKRRKKFA